METDNRDSSTDAEAPEADSGSTELATRPQTVATTKRRESIRSLQRQLTDEDLKNPGAQRLILEDWERAEAACEEMRDYVGKYHEQDKLAAVLQAKIHGLTRVDTLFGICLAVGGALIGMIPSLGLAAAIAGGILCIAAVFIRIRA